MHALTRIGLLVSSLALVPSARADDKAPSHAMKPAQALTDAFSGMAGTWTCKGQFQTKSGTGESTSTMVLKRSVNGFAYSGEVTVAKNASLPAGMTEQLSWSYNAVTHKLVEFFVDSFGDVGSGTSDGLSGDTTVWEEDSVMMGQSTKSRTTVKRLGPKEVSLNFEVQMDGKWTSFGIKTCKKH